MNFFKTLVWYMVSGVFIFTLNKFEFISAFTSAIATIILVLVLLSYSVYHLNIIPRKIEKVTRILLEDLDAQKSIVELTKLLESKKMTKISKVEARLALVLGYVADGKETQAIEICKRLLKKIDSRRASYVYYHLSLIYLSQGDLKNGLVYYQLVNSAKHTIHSKNMMLNLEALVDYLQGRYDESLNKFQVILEDIRSEYHKLTVHFRLAEVYKALDDINKQKEHLQYVSKHGKKLHIANVARRMVN